MMGKGDLPWPEVKAEDGFMGLAVGGSGLEELEAPKVRRFRVWAFMPWVETGVEFDMSLLENCVGWAKVCGLRLCICW